MAFIQLLNGILKMKLINRLIEVCEICGSSAVEFFQHPNTPLQNYNLKNRSGNGSENITLLYCESCQFAFTKEILFDKYIFNQHYNFRTSSTITLRESLNQLAERIATSMNRQPYQILDIGCNDGYLLSLFKSELKVGIEPVQRTQGRQSDIYYITDFAPEALKEIQDKKFDLVCMTNVLGHLDNASSTMEAAYNLLEDDGVISIEVLDLDVMIEDLEFDKFTPEHRRYFNSYSLQKYLEMFNLEALHMEKIPIHGGSLRCIARKYSGSHERKSISSHRNPKFKSEIESFKNRTDTHLLNLKKTIMKYRSEGKKVVGVGASNRGFLTLHALGLDESVIEAVTDRPNSNHIGGFVPGTDIPIKTDDLLFHTSEVVALILAWNIAAEIEKNLLSKGFRGIFLKPLPELNSL